MATVKEDNTEAAIEQLGSMSLGESVGKKDNETEANDDAEKNGTPTKSCSWCGKKSDTHKKCRNCKCVWYCGKECQNKHWKEHKIECRRVKKELDKRGGQLDLGTEKEVGPIGNVPPRDECPICMQVLPIYTKLHFYQACCGKMICGGCDFQHKLKSGKQKTCAFCRTPLATTDEEILARVRKRAALNDKRALLNLAWKLGNGTHGLPVDRAKCIELLRQSADLGFCDAHHMLGEFYRNGEMGLEQNEEEAIKCWEKAAECGHLHARHNVGAVEFRDSDVVAAMRHLRLAASGGFGDSIESLIRCFERGWLHHADLSETMQAYYLARDEMRSDDRKRYIQHLKDIGEYEPEHDW